MKLVNIKDQTLASFLTCEALSATVPPSEDIYGWLIGTWDLDVLQHRGLRTPGLTGEAHFVRVLGGLAVQDVWIISDRPAAGDLVSYKMFGTTLRFWDQSLAAWRITWTNPAAGVQDTLVGRRVGEQIVQIGHHSDGRVIRWIFSHIRERSFQWLGEVLGADGATWTAEAEFLGRRRTSH